MAEHTEAELAQIVAAYHEALAELDRDIADLEAASWEYEDEKAMQLRYLKGVRDDLVDDFNRAA